MAAPLITGRTGSKSQAKKKKVKRFEKSLVIAYQKPGSEAIQSFHITYRRLSHFALSVLTALLLLIYLIPVNAADPSHSGAGEWEEYADFTDLDREADLIESSELDADIREFLEVYRELKDNTEELLEYQKEIHRDLVDAYDHSLYVDYLENKLKSLDDVTLEAKDNPKKFIAYRYLIRRINVHGGLMTYNRAYAGFYDRFLQPLPHRSPMGGKKKLKVNSPYGVRKKPGRGRYAPIEFHRGLDLYGKTGEEVFAAARGRVRLARSSRGGYGNLVILEHPGGYETLYAHLSAINVKKDQHVRSGELLGLVGRSGNTTGPHLHYEIRRHKKPMDPGTFLNINHRLK